jgi:hypothetical protein
MDEKLLLILFDKGILAAVLLFAGYIFNSNPMTPKRHRKLRYSFTVGKKINVR